MSEHEIEEITEAQLEVQIVLEEYGLGKDEIEEAVNRIVNILIDALDAMKEDSDMA